MPHLTNTEKNQLIAIHSKIVSTVKTKYNNDTEFQGLTCKANDAGALISLILHVDIQTPADQDGVRVKVPKDIEIMD
jgi:hypothetical protein|tara:strand:+ start:1874 stop:2104 length:231 start_codon:yes stop_codon:yes gene_type:complete